MLVEWTGEIYRRLLRNIKWQRKGTQDVHSRDFWIVTVRQEWAINSKKLKA
jgi:hypothetical protein